MQTVSRISRTFGQAETVARIPLTQLFAYIRDLYHVENPVTQFDKEALAWWPLAMWRNWAGVSAPKYMQLPQIDGRSPLLLINRGNAPAFEIPEELKPWLVQTETGWELKKEQYSAFDADEDRVQLYQEWQADVQGKSLEAVGTIVIPPQLADWLEFSLEEGKVRVAPKDAGEDFAANPARLEQYTQFEAAHRDYQTQYGNLGAINTLYDTLHTVYYQLKAQPQYQVYLSFGLISGKIGGQPYHNYLFHVPLKFQLQQHRLSLEFDTLTSGVICEADFLSLLEAHFPKQAEVVEIIQAEMLTAIDAFNQETHPLSLEPAYLERIFYPLATKLLACFNKTQDAFFQHGEAYLPYSEQSEISLYFAPVVQVKAINPYLHIAKDAANILASIQELEAEGLGEYIPDFFHRLFSVKESPGIRLAYNREKIELENPTNDAFLFPLPYNEEQMAIARQLEKQDVVIVKGPPGTGKSHTIANLISHHVADGKSVLVVSQNAKALEVVRNKLPLAIRDLSVSLVDEGDQRDILRKSVETINRKLGTTADTTEIERLQGELEELRQKQEDLEAQLLLLDDLHEHVQAVYNPYTDQIEEKSLVEWAKLLAAQSQDYQIIQDAIAIDQDLSALEPHLLAYLQLAPSIAQVAHDVLAGELPNPENWPKVEEVAQTAYAMQAIEMRIPVKNFEGVSPECLEEAFALDLAKAFVAWKELQPHKKLLSTPGFQPKGLIKLVEEKSELFAALQDPFLDHIVDLGDLAAEGPERLLRHISQLKERLGDRNELNGLGKALLPAELKALYQIRIDRLPLQSGEQLQILHAYVQYLGKKKQAEIVLQNYFGGLQPESAQEDPRILLDRLLEIYKQVCLVETANDLLHNAGLPLIPYHADALPATLAFVHHLEDIRLYQALTQKYQGMEQAIQQVITENTPQVLHKMVEAIAGRAIQQYEGLHKLYAAMYHTAGKVRRGEELYQLIAAQLPHTAQFIRKGRLDLPAVPDMAFVREQIFHARLSAFIDEKARALGLGISLSETMQTIKQNKETLIAELVAARTWQRLGDRVTPEQRAALMAWQNDLINIGKGQGKNTLRNLRSAIQNMQRAKHVVPVWIMQQDLALRFFADPSPRQFDLLIVDEASQCDISTMNLIYRAKKCMIVGDENQTSVYVPARRFPIERTNQLLDRHLNGHPFSQQFNINNRTASIYSLSGILYPNIITLTEHFRCRPEIIGFSNKYVYHNQIHALKGGLTQEWGAALEAHFVEEETGDLAGTRMAEAIAERIEAFILGFEAGEISRIPSVGILALDSSNEAHIQRLLYTLSKHKLIRKYEDVLNLLVGTARKFQGDERDIIILTSTAQAKQKQNGAWIAPKAVQGDEMMRIYNVAASRAREKSIVYHCLPPEALAAMPDSCFRKRLIDYYSQPHLDVKSKSTGASRPFVEAVKNWLLQEGIGERIQTHFRLGSAQIDIAIEQQGAKYALLCQGTGHKPLSYEAQHMLERIGWKVFRLYEFLWNAQREEMENALRSWAIASDLQVKS